MPSFSLIIQQFGSLTFKNLSRYRFCVPTCVLICQGLKYRYFMYYLFLIIVLMILLILQVVITTFIFTITLHLNPSQTRNRHYFINPPRLLKISRLDRHHRLNHRDQTTQLLDCIVHFPKTLTISYFIFSFKASTFCQIFQRYTFVLDYFITIFQPIDFDYLFFMFKLMNSSFFSMKVLRKFLQMSCYFDFIMKTIILFNFDCFVYLQLLFSFSIIHYFYQDYLFYLCLILTRLINHFIIFLRLKALNFINNTRKYKQNLF